MRISIIETEKVISSAITSKQKLLLAEVNKKKAMRNERRLNSEKLHEKTRNYLYLTLDVIDFLAIASSLFLSQPFAFNVFLPRSTIEHEPYSPVQIDHKTNIINNQSRARVIDSHLYEVNDLQESQRTKHLPLSAFALFIKLLSSLP